jgi:hypothetical protein
MAEHKILLQLRPPQIEVTMAQTQFFCGKLLSLASRDWNRRSFSRPDQSHGTCADLDISSSQLRVPHFGRPQRDVTFDDYDALLAKGSRFLDLWERSPLRVERYLQDAGSIAKIEEDNSAQIS